MIRRLFLAVWILAAAMPASAGPDTVIIWQTVHWPPFQILKGDDKGLGRFDAITRLLQEGLPQYEHRSMEMNWSRYWEDVQAGKHILNCMAIKTEERARHAVFSDVVTVTLPHRVIMKRSRILEMGNPASVRLSDLIADERFSGSIEKGRSYSSALDEIFDAQKDNSWFGRTALSPEQVLKMILSGRIDYTIEYPFVVDYILKKEIDSPVNLLGSIAIRELPRFIAAHVAAPKNSWGERVVRDINQVIKTLKTTQTYLDIHLMWHSDSGEVKEIKEIYHEVFSD